ncbi:MAG: toxin [Candidatus Taylorbacteria bacterium]|nr:toxin [Candidatus Taylorbacteria bacterium]
MKYIDWNAEKNERLRREREIGFEDIRVALEEGGLLDIIPNPNTRRYPGQKVFVVAVGGYAYLVPFAEDKERIFLKTIIPSRKAKKKYIVKRKK